MYNPQKIIELLTACGCKKKDLLDYIGKNFNGSINAILSPNIKAVNLEKVADFFKVPIDYFFEREPANTGVMVGGVKNRVHHFSVGNQGPDVDALNKLIEEKDKRIATLEDLVSILKTQILMVKSAGQISDIPSPNPNDK